MTADTCTICEAAAKAIDAFGAWLSEPGFDNPELDGMNDAMRALSNALGHPVPITDED